MRNLYLYYKILDKTLKNIYLVHFIQNKCILSQICQPFIGQQEIQLIKVEIGRMLYILVHQQLIGRLKHL